MALNEENILQIGDVVQYTVENWSRETPRVDLANSTTTNYNNNNNNV